MGVYFWMLAVMLSMTKLAGVRAKGAWVVCGMGATLLRWHPGGVVYGYDISI